MIGKVIRGTDAGRLLHYLYGTGNANEHVDPHLVAGFGDPGEIEPARRLDGSWDLRRLTALLTLPLVALRQPGFAKPVWHCAVRAAPGDRLLSDAEWGQVATGIMNRTGLAAEDDWFPVRWVAVRHAADHIHIVATLARQDGQRPRIWNDFYRVREACQAAERDLGLRGTPSADRTAARRSTRAETEQAARRGWAEPSRVTLRREVCAAAAGAGSEQEFFARLDAAGVAVRRRFSTVKPSEVTGYAVGLPQHAGKDGGMVWFGGGKLAADLTLPKLRRRWEQPQRATADHPGAVRFTAQDRNEIYEHAARRASVAARHIRHCSVHDPARGADAAWAAADALHMAARALRNPTLRQAADAYDRAARNSYGRIPRRTREGESLRALARSLGCVADLQGDASQAPLVLIARLVGLAAAVAELRQAQQHAAQAAAARQTTEYLKAALIRARRARPAGTTLRDQSRPRNEAAVARDDCPAPPTLKAHPSRPASVGHGPGSYRPGLRRPPGRAGPAP